MQPGNAVAIRDRAILGVRLGTVAAIMGALGFSWLFAVLAEAYFSGKPPAPPPVPSVPQLAAPVQKAPPVSVVVVHHVGYPPGSGANQPRPPGAAPRPQPPPAPPPCHSTPSKPC